MGKTLLRKSQAPLGLVGNEDQRDLPLQLPPVALEVVSYRRPRCHLPYAQGQALDVMHRGDELGGEGGSASRSLVPGIVAPVPLAPRLVKNPYDFCSHYLGCQDP